MQLIAVKTTKESIVIQLKQVVFKKFDKLVLIKMMAVSKKRAADLEGTAQSKKPKFEKKSIQKKNFDQNKGNNTNPFQKGRGKARFYQPFF